MKCIPQRPRPRRALLESLEQRLCFHAELEGTGLLAQYFDNKDFTNPALQRTDATVNFAWGTAAPAPGMGVDTFSVRWTGQLVAESTGNYTFSTTTDDGVRLWINNTLVIDKLINQAAKTYSTAPIALTHGEAVEIRMDYFDNTGQAKAQLMWAGPGFAKQVIPKEHLFASPPPPPTPPPPPPPPSAIRIDAAGSKTYVDELGKTWSADKFYSGGTLSLGAFNISGTNDDAFYATRRIGKTFGYNIPVAPGNYKLNLLFADESYGVGGRLFNVFAEGKQILNRFDIIAAGSGKGVAVTQSFNINLTDNTLNLTFAGVLNNATISAIELIPVLGPETSQIAWQVAAPSPVVRAEALGRVINDKLYVLGGLANDAEGHIIGLTRCDVYDPATNTWTQLNDEPEAITHAGVAVDGTNLWLVGGYIGNHPGPGTAHVWKYDTTTDTWTAGPDLPVARGAGTAVIIDRKLHFVGGMDETRTIDEGDHFVLDLDDPQATWRTLAPLANPRNHVSAATVGGKMYVIGGQHAQESAQDPQLDVDCYDPLTDTWTRVADLPAPRSHVSASTFVLNDKIIVLGGENGYNLPQSTIYQYDPALNTWSLLGLLPGNRSTSVAGVLSDGRIITATGNTPNPSASTWIGTLPS